jgi:hypothetical protein
MNPELVDKVRLRTAELAVGPSTVRGAGAKGVVRAARDGLKAVPLRRFRVRSRRAFERELEFQTEELRARLPRGTRHWGVARKVLNIYLRAVLHHRHLCAAYGLAPIEAWLELPLDRHVVEGIREADPSGRLPRWKTIKGLDPETSAIFQAAARSIAASRRVLPIHLEYLWWRERP